MKNLFYLAILFLSFYSFSQINSVEGKVEYIESYNPGTKEMHTLFFNKYGSFYEQEIDKDLKEKKVVEKGDGTFSVSYGYNLKTTEYVSLELSNKESFFRKKFGMELLTVKDSIERIEWQLKEEIKEIGSFLCQKAIGKYRGRMYEVWFTNEIPVPFGPWKLNGLSGLVLEVYESTGAYSITATKIELGKGGKEYESKLEELDLKDVISLEEYKQIVETELQSTINYINSRLPKGSSLTNSKTAEEQARRNALEIFEDSKD